MLLLLLLTVFVALLWVLVTWARWLAVAAMLSLLFATRRGRSILRRVIAKREPPYR